MVKNVQVDRLPSVEGTNVVKGRIGSQFSINKTDDYINSLLQQKQEREAREQSFKNREDEAKAAENAKMEAFYKKNPEQRPA